MTRIGPTQLTLWIASCLMVGALPCAVRAQSSANAAASSQTTKAVAANDSPKPDARHAEEAYLAGARLTDSGQLAAAQDEFARAVALAPARQDYALALALTREHRVGALIRQAAQTRMTGHPAEADALLAEAMKIDPHNEFLLQHTSSGSAGPLVGDVRDPKSTRPQTQVKTTGDVPFSPPIELAPRAGRQDLHLRGDAKTVVTRAAAVYGIKTVFDDSANSTAGPPNPDGGEGGGGNGQVRFDMDATSYNQAMPILLRMTHLFGVAIDSTTLLVAKDTEESRQKFERQVEESIYIPAATTEQLNELKNIVQNVFDVKQVVVSANNGMLLVRAPAATLKTMNYVLADLVDGGAEVLLEVKLITVDKSLTHNTGASPPTSFSAFSAASELQSFVNANQSTINTAVSSGALVLSGSAANMLLQEGVFLLVSGLATDAKLFNVIRFFGNGLTLFAVSTPGGGTFSLALNSSEAHALDDIQVRVDDGKTATLRVGERYPITVSQYSSGVSSATTSALAGVSINGVSASSLVSQYLGNSAASTVPVIQYEDLGITLKTTPTVMKSGLIKVNLDLKIEALTGTSANGIPVLTNSNFVSDITLKEGTTAVMMSEMSSTESASVSGLPLLSELPGFNETLSDRLKTTDKSELVLMVTPHLVRRRSASMASRRISFRSSEPVDN